MKLKKIQSGYYKTLDGRFTIEKCDGFWYATDDKTGQSVVDCENTFRQIKESLEYYINHI
jgi:hypothetical protein